MACPPLGFDSPDSRYLFACASEEVRYLNCISFIHFLMSMFFSVLAGRLGGFFSLLSLFSRALLSHGSKRFAMEGLFYLLLNLDYETGNFVCGGLWPPR